MEVKEIQSTEAKLNDCLDRLVALKEGWPTNELNHNQLDANWVCVSIPKSIPLKVRRAVGAKKESIYGWVLWSGSTQDNGTNFEDEVRVITAIYGLQVQSQQL